VCVCCCAGGREGLFRRLGGTGPPVDDRTQIGTFTQSKFPQPDRPATTIPMCDRGVRQHPAATVYGWSSGDDTVHGGTAPVSARRFARSGGPPVGVVRLPYRRATGVTVQLASSGGGRSLHLTRTHRLLRMAATPAASFYHRPRQERRACSRAALRLGCKGKRPEQSGPRSFFQPSGPILVGLRP
jgi:hypothetical protein